jgi:aminoglycoside 6'-N-acetyltransferase
MFIGEPELWDRGLGSGALSMLVAYLYSEAGAHSIVIDPRLTNGRAIRAYEKAGFRKVKVLHRHEFHEGAWQDNWLMVHGHGPTAAQTRAHPL